MSSTNPRVLLREIESVLQSVIALPLPNGIALLEERIRAEAQRRTGDPRAYELTMEQFASDGPRRLRSLATLCASLSVFPVD